MRRYPVAGPAGQMELFNKELGERLKEQGRDRTEASNDGWVELARIEARRIAEANGTVSVDALRAWADRTNNHPRSPNAWGAVFRGGWELHGYVKSAYLSNHARRVCVWRLARNA